MARRVLVLRCALALLGLLGTLIIPGNLLAQSTLAASQILIVMPGQSFEPGAGITGTPDPVQLREPFIVKVYAVDASGNLAADASMPLKISTDDPTPVVGQRFGTSISGINAATSGTNGSLRLSVNGLAFEEYDIGPYASALQACAAIESPPALPPFVPFAWGAPGKIKCEFDSFSLRYTLFLDDGTPVRAIMDTSLMKSPDVDARSLVVDPTFGSAPGLELGVLGSSPDPNEPAEYTARSEAQPIPDDSRISRGFAAFTIQYVDPNNAGPGHTLVVTQPGGPALPVVQDSFTVEPSSLEIKAVILYDRLGTSGAIDQADVYFSDIVDPNTVAGSAGSFSLTLSDPNGPPLTVPGVSVTSQTVTDLGYTGSMLRVTFAGELPGTSRKNVTYVASGGGLTDLDANPLTPITLTESSSRLIDGASPVILSAQPYDLDFNGLADQIVVQFSEDIHFGAGRGASVSGVHPGDPNTIAIPSSSSLRVRTDGTPGPGPIDKTVTLVHPEDPNQLSIQGGPTIARAIEDALRRADPRPPFAHFTVSFDNSFNRFVLRSGVAGPTQTVEVLPAGLPGDAAPALKLGSANGGWEAPGTPRLLPDMAEFVILSPDGKTNLLGPASTIQVIGNMLAITLNESVPATQTPEFVYLSVPLGGGIRDLSAWALPLKPFSSVQPIPSLLPSNSGFIRIRDIDSNPNDGVLTTPPATLTLDASDSIFTLTGVDLEGIYGFAWRQISGPEPLTPASPGALVTTMTVQVPGQHLMEAVAQVRPPLTPGPHPYTDSDGTIRRPFRIEVLCVDDAGCDDGNPCNGAESCNLSTGACQAAPPVVDVCDGIDNDCDGATDEGQIEVCNGLDDDCDGLLPPAERDMDGDGVRVCGGDCDDTNAGAFAAPGTITGLDVTDPSPNTLFFAWDNLAAAYGPGTVYDVFLARVSSSSLLPGALQGGVCEAEDLPFPQFGVDLTSGFTPAAGEMDYRVFMVVSSCGSSGSGNLVLDAQMALSPGACRLGGGAPCSSPGACGSSFCSDEGFCCDTACAGPCRTCAGGPGIQRGTCSSHPYGTDPENGCSGFTCDGSGACRSACANDGDCAAGFFCGATSCQPKRPVGEACLSNSQCARPGSTDPAENGFCSDGFCCDMGCSGACQACNHAGLEGTCSADLFGSGPAEACNSADDDCDGLTDEGFGIGAACDGVGACGAGVRECAGSSSVRCSTDPGGSQNQSSIELCDGVDNNCDGTIDAFPTSCGAGVCASTGICSAGSNTCVPITPPGPEICGDGLDNDCDGSTDVSDVDCSAAELCDGLDNDADGLTDESFLVGQPCVVSGICGVGALECATATSTRCSTARGGSEDASSAERCNGLDDDCDGTLDEGCSCQEGATQSCGTDVGECARGGQICDGAELWGSCSGSIGPTPEQFDSLDNDCDGLTDEGFTDTPCMGIGQCREGFVQLTSGPFELCSSMPFGADDQSSIEVCDSADNDCDGFTDEACPCTNGTIQPCGYSAGACGRGTQTCTAGSWGACTGSVEPAPDRCDGLDNDCDGSTDEDALWRGKCGTGECGASGVCIAGVETCTPGTPSPETCDGLDNDCDRSTDEDFLAGRPCEGAGSCGSGVMECLGPSASVCSSEPGGSRNGSVPEVCDGVDDDCDGQTDEADAGCLCTPSMTQVCGRPRAGECVQGVQTCQANGVWGACDGAIDPAVELCDGLDNDCDGSTDEPFGIGEVCHAGGACGSGFPGCVSVTDWICSTAPGGSADASRIESCNGIDDDCDGATDEEVCLPGGPGSTLPCGTSTGECSAGVWRRGTDGVTGTCSATAPEVELCDGLDNDCDGDTDGVYDLGGPCVHTGICRGGTRECTLDLGATCSTAPGGSANGSSVEVCDGLDNDCDGVVDEKSAGCVCAPGQMQSCGLLTGECSPGFQQCQGDGTWGTCTGGTEPVAETCDGLDNDCDGIADEDVAFTRCGVGECRTTGLCSGGSDTCVPLSGSTETCDGLDNDCDGATDEDFTYGSAGVGDGCEGVSSCGSGVVECAGPTAARCSSGPLGSRDESGLEICNGLDDDCDGSFDETCSCTPGQIAVCGTSEAGLCSRGTKTCTAGSFWGACSGNVEPVVEICDGVDDDCDGLTDESFDIGSPCVGSGVCGGGVRECAGPAGARCSTSPGGSGDLSSPEICDGLDNDCDGTTDEADAGCVCMPPASQTCGSGIGVCVTAAQSCASTGDWADCRAAEPSVELCNGLDDDCDGLLDDDIPETRCGIGACAQVLTNPCSGGTPLSCMPLAPSGELCDGLDNDCDGFTDENYGVEKQPGPNQSVCNPPGACGVGVFECTGPGSSRCSTGPGGSQDQSRPEACDGADNDCDGSTDEGAGCYGQGIACVDGVDCLSGSCTNGVCCDSACPGVCRGCDVPLSEGVCTYNPSGTDPDNDCGGFTCDGAGSCMTNCATHNDCAPTFHCASGDCIPGEPLGGLCEEDQFCANATYHCNGGFCCESATCGPGETCSTGQCKRPAYGQCETESTAPFRLPAEPARVSVEGHSGFLLGGFEDLRIPGVGLDLIWSRWHLTDWALIGMGNGWTAGYDIRLMAGSAGVLILDGEGRADFYSPQPGGTWAHPECSRELSVDPNGIYTLLFPDTGKWVFNAVDGSPKAGRIASIVDKNNNDIAMEYDPLGRLTAITDTLGRITTLQYNPDGTVASVTDPFGRMVAYAYYDGVEPGGSLRDLKSVTTPAVTGTPNGNDFPAGKTTLYTYTTGFADDRLNHRLLTITDPKGQTRLTNLYASTTNPADPDFGRVVRQLIGSPGDVVDYVYVPLAPGPGNNFAVTKAIVNDRAGNVSESFYDNRNRLVIFREYTGRANPDLPTSATFNRPAGKLRPSDPTFFETRYAYNANSLVTSVLNPNGDTVEIAHEGLLNPAASPRTRGNVRQIHRLPGPLGGDQAQIDEFFTYDPGPGAIGTNWVATYTDGRGNVTQHTHDGRGNEVAMEESAIVPAMLYDFEYDSSGRMTARILPDNGSGFRRRDTFSYYMTGPQAGYLHQQVIDPNGLALTTTYEYDERGNLVRAVDPKGNDTLYVLNQRDQIVRTTSREVTTGSGVRYSADLFYDLNDNLVKKSVENRDELGVLAPNTNVDVEWGFDYRNLVRSVTEEVDPNQSVVTEFQYDDNANLTLVRNPEAVSGGDPGNTVSYFYDERGLPFRTIGAPGSPIQSTTQYDYDGNGNLTRRSTGIEATPSVVLYTYDGYGRFKSFTDSMGNVRSHTHDANGNWLTTRVDGEMNDVTGGAGNVRLYESVTTYDAVNRPTQVDISHFNPATQMPIGDGISRTQYTYNGYGQVRSLTNDNGHVTQASYDNAYRVLESRDPRLNLTTYEYDLNGNVSKVTEVDKSDLGNPDRTLVTTSQYDNLDRPVGSVDNLGNARQAAYDSHGYLVVWTDERGNVTRYSHDGLMRPLQAVRALTNTGEGGGTAIGSITTTQAWDRSSRAIGWTDGNGNVTTQSYDSLDRPTVTTMPDGTAVSRTWNIHGKISSTNDANGSVVTNTYDLLNRLSSRSVLRGPGVLGTTMEAIQYDGGSRVVSAQDDDSRVTLAYDSLSNVMVETLQPLPAGSIRTTLASHDSMGNLKSLTYPGGRSIVFSHDGLNRVSLIEEAPAGPGADIAAVQYVGPARIERLSYGNGTRYEPQYDGARRITGTRHLKTPTMAAFDDRAYQWDRADNKTFAQDSLAFPPEQRFHGFDSISRLKATQIVAGTAQPPVQYLLDNAGNRAEVINGPDPGLYTMSPATPEPADLQENQYTTTPFDGRSYDRNGNLIQSTGGGPTIQMAYDYRDQLVRHTNVGAGLMTTYGYDWFGHRFEKNNGAMITRDFHYVGIDIEAQDGSGTTLATYVPGTGIQSIVEMTRGGQEYFFHADDLGSIRKVTNASGSVVEQYKYEDYGGVQVFGPPPINAPLPGSQIGNPFLFKSYRLDPESGFYTTNFVELNDRETSTGTLHDPGGSVAGPRAVGLYLDSRSGRSTARQGTQGEQGESSLGNGYTYSGNNPVSRPLEGPAAVEVVDPGGLGALRLGAYTYLPSPSALSTSPVDGTWLGGTGVSVSGAGLSPLARVTFGGGGSSPEAFCSTIPYLDVVKPQGETISLNTAADHCVQYRESDLAFVTRLAPRIGYEVQVDDTESQTGKSTPILFTWAAYRPLRSTPVPKIFGVQTGIVTAIAPVIGTDPFSYGRVKVQFPWDHSGGCGSDESCWARISILSAGKERGYYSIPEVSDEVLVGFLQGDINHPYVLGSIWNGGKNPGPIGGPCARRPLSGGGRWVTWSPPSVSLLVDDCNSAADVYHRGPVR